MEMRRRDAMNPSPTTATARGGSTSLRRVVGRDDADTEDSCIVDFANASLYLAGLQTVFSIVTCAFVSVLSCWIVPGSGVSAVRTLAVCVAAGCLLMLKPLRVGRSHGIKIVFASLQPAVPIYLLALVVEQLVHTCTSDTSNAPSWRRVVLHRMILVMVVAGMMRSRHPLKDTDSPFLLTSTALLVIAIMPPPAVALVGPLCQSVTLWEAADRLVRAFAFAILYCVHVYALTATTNLTKSETMICVSRSASASLWTLGAHVFWLPLAILQSGIVILARIRIEQKPEYSPVADTSDDELARLEMGEQPPPPPPPPPQSIDVIAQQRELLAQPTAIALAEPAAEPETLPPSFGPISFREIGGHEPSAATAATMSNGIPMTAERMAEIASRIE
jgi:hypothetical protein